MAALHGRGSMHTGANEFMEISCGVCVKGPGVRWLIIITRVCMPKETIGHCIYVCT